MNNIQAGLLAAAPLSALGIGYMFAGGRALVELVATGTEEASSMTYQQWFYLMLGSLAAAPFIFGLLAGLVYGWLDNATIFRLVALGIAVLLSVLAAVSRTPMLTMKVVMNFLVALVFGMLVPFLVGD